MTHWGWLARVDVIPFALLGLGLTGPIFAMWFASMTLVQAQTASIRVRALLATDVLEGAAIGGDICRQLPCSA